MSYDINFWKQLGPPRLSPEGVYGRLCEGKNVKGLAKLPVEEILDRLQFELSGFDPKEEFPLVSLQDGSIEISWSDQHFRFDFRGHVPEKTRKALVAIMKDFGCPLYDPQLDERYDTADGMGCAPAPSVEASEPSRPYINDLLKAIAAEAQVELQPAPSVIKLQHADVKDFPDAEWLADLTRQCDECGYARIGDFMVSAFSITFRAFYLQPNVIACLYQHELGLNWSEIIVFNADATSEVWCTWAGDPIVPPWSKRVVEQCRFLDLHDMMLEGWSGKPPAQLSASEFPQLFEASCARELQWRQSK